MFSCPENNAYWKEKFAGNFQGDKKNGQGTKYVRNQENKIYRSSVGNYINGINFLKLFR